MDTGDGGIVHEISDDETPSEAVIRAAAVLEDVDETVLEPLYDSVDAEALDSLMTSGNSATRVEFEYHGYSVMVTSVEVRLEPVD